MPSLLSLLTDAPTLVIYLIAALAIMGGSILLVGAFLLNGGNDAQHRETR